MPSFRVIELPALKSTDKDGLVLPPAVSKVWVTLVAEPLVVIGWNETVPVAPVTLAAVKATVIVSPAAKLEAVRERR